MSLREKFEADVPRFLATHMLAIDAGKMDDLEKLANFGPFQGAGARAVSLVAPNGYAKFELVAAKTIDPVVKCGVAEVNLKLTTDTQQMPVYVIPYVGKGSRGVKLPSGQGRAYAITTRIDGCTFTVSGSAAEPYAMHSNAFSLDETVSKSDSMRAHIVDLERQFREAEGLDDDADPFSATRTHFNFNMDELATRPSRYINYSERVQQACANEGLLNERFSSKKGVFSHKKTSVRMDEYYYNALMQNNNALTNAVVGVRDQGTWTFYSNTFVSVRFVVKEQKKVRSNVKSESSRKVSCWAVVSSGEFWPNDNVRFKPFFSRV